MPPPVQTPAEGVIIVFLVVGLVLAALVRRLGRSRPEFTIGLAIAVAFGLRLFAIAGLNSTGLGSSLRGGDETTFLTWANVLAHQPLGHGDLPHGHYQLQTILFALQIMTGVLNETALRITQVGIALTGYVFLIAAVYDLAGSKAARYTAWFLAFEPASMFFNSEIHKEALMDLAAGLVVFGGVWVWKRLDIRGVLICALGCLIAIETRGYAGWFMACGAVMLLAHASMRQMRQRPAALPLLYVLIIGTMIAAPAIYAYTGGQNLKKLQLSQAQNATGVGQQGHSNLKLEAVNVSSRGAIITSLPTKIQDLLLQPYPWQVHDSSQMFGALGTLVFYAFFGLLIRLAWLSRGKVFSRAGPLLYTFLFQMIAYSITVGNAGTGFRYRSHLTPLVIGAAMVLHAKLQESRATETPTELEPALASAHAEESIAAGIAHTTA